MIVAQDWVWDRGVFREGHGFSGAVAASKIY